MAPSLPSHLQHLNGQYAWLKILLADGRQFIFGDAPSALDLACLQTTALMRQNCPLSELDAMVDMAALLPWYGRAAALARIFREAHLTGRAT